MRAILAEPGAKLLVYGDRRMGKTSTLRVAIAEHGADGGLAGLADFSTATSYADLANRILGVATKALGRRWRDIALDFSGRLGTSLDTGIDLISQLPTASLRAGLRNAGVAEQRDALARVLDSIEAICAQRGVSLGLVLDEFQEIHRLGGEEAEWHLRGVIQHHQHISYIVAGSRTHLIERMISPSGAFYKVFDVLAIGPIDTDILAAWIDRSMTSGGVGTEGVGTGGVGRELIRVAGPRTRDVIQLARKVFDIAVQEEDGAVNADLVGRAFSEVVQDESEPLQALWNSYSPAQENVLRAVAAGAAALTSADTLQRFSLRSSAAATQSAASLIEKGVLVQTAPGSYRCDSPFQRGWVVTRALPDMGIELPVTFAGPPS